MSIVYLLRYSLYKCYDDVSLRHSRIVTLLNFSHHQSVQYLYHPHIAINSIFHEMNEWMAKAWIIQEFSFPIQSQPYFDKHAKRISRKFSRFTRPPFHHNDVLNENISLKN